MRCSRTTMKECPHWYLSLWQQPPPFNAPIPRPTTLTTPNDRSIGSCTSAQLCNKVPISYNWTPKIHPKSAPSPSMITIPSNTSVPWTTPLTIPNGIRIHSAVLPQVLFPDTLMDRPIDTQTDRWARWQVSRITEYARYTDSNWCAKKCSLSNIQRTSE